MPRPKEQITVVSNRARRTASILGRGELTVRRVLFCQHGESVDCPDCGRSSFFELKP